MSAPKNIQRDGTYLYPKDVLIVPGSEYLATATTVLSNGPSATAIDYAKATLDFEANTAITILFARTFGIFINQPVGDRHPYRVKAALAYHEYVGAVSNLIIGYGPATQTGSDDVITEIVKIPFLSIYDDLIIVDALPPGDALENRSLFIGIELNPAVAITATARGHISVQNLGVKPPTMQNAVS